MPVDSQRMMVDAAAAIDAGDTTPPKHYTAQERRDWNDYIIEIEAIRARGYMVDIPNEWV